MADEPVKITITNTFARENPASYDSKIAEVLARKREAAARDALGLATSNVEALKTGRLGDILAQIHAAQRKIEDMMRVPPELLGEEPRFVGGVLGGVSVAVSTAATEHDGWNWKPSRHRSSRVHKKLVKRFGSHERRRPAAFRIEVPWMPPKIICRPAIYDKLMAEFRGNANA